MKHDLKLLHSVQLTPDTKRYVFTRPENYRFTPGQATELALDQDGWREEGRPFTFTSHPDADVLAFTIKSYFDHDGVTKRLWSLETGDRVSIGDAWGAIEPKGPGVFLAGGAGITPFIAVIEHLSGEGKLDGSILVFANATHRDIILRPQFEQMQGLKTVFVTDDGENADRAGRLEPSLLDDVIPDYDRRFYVCGPPRMEEGVADHLKARNVSEDRIVREE